MHYGVMLHNTIEPQLFLDALASQAIPARPASWASGETLVIGQ